MPVTSNSPSARCRDSSISRACGSWSIAPTAPAYKVAPAALWELGAEVVSVGVEPNGFNINHEVGSTAPEALIHKVRELRADMGIALDGDADRVLIVDEPTEDVADRDRHCVGGATTREGHGRMSRPARLRGARHGEQLRDLLAVADQRVRTAGPGHHAAGLPRHLQEDRAVGRYLLFGLDHFRTTAPAASGAGRFGRARAGDAFGSQPLVRGGQPFQLGFEVGDDLVRSSPGRVRALARCSSVSRTIVNSDARQGTGFASSTASCSGVATPSASAPTYMSNCHGARSSTPINGFTRLHLPVAGGFGVHPRRSAGGSCHFRVPPARRPRRCRPVSMHCAVGTIAAAKCSDRHGAGGHAPSEVDRGSGGVNPAAGG